MKCFVLRRSSGAIEHRVTDSHFDTFGGRGGGTTLMQRFSFEPPVPAPPPVQPPPPMNSKSMKIFGSSFDYFA